MAVSKTSGQRLVVLAIALALAAVAVACSGPALPSGSSLGQPSSSPATSAVAPTVSPSPSPSQEPAVALLANLHDGETSALLSIRMTETVSSAILIDGVAMSPAPPDLDLEYGGEVLVVGDDHLARLKADGENDVVVESIRRDGRTWRRFMADGWATGADEPRLPDLLRTIESLEPLGTVERDGRTLLRFASRTAMPIQLATIWRRDEPGGETDDGAIEILAAADGAPVAAIVTISSDDLSMPIPNTPPPEPRTYRMELAWDEAPPGAIVPDPSEKLAPMAVAEHDLTIGLPVEWKRETVDGIWVWFEAPGPDAYVGVARIEVPASAIDDPPTAQLAGWSRAIITDSQKELGVEPAVVEAVRAGGVPGRLATYRVPANGNRPASTQIDAMFVSKAWGYVVKWQSDTHFDLVARYRFERILESLDLSGG